MSKGNFQFHYLIGKGGFSKVRKIKKNFNKIINNINEFMRKTKKKGLENREEEDKGIFCTERNVKVQVNSNIFLFSSLNLNL